MPQQLYLRTGIIAQSLIPRLSIYKIKLHTLKDRVIIEQQKRVL
jgi:hypothetical protein